MLNWTSFVHTVVRLYGRHTSGDGLPGGRRTRDNPKPNLVETAGPNKDFQSCWNPFHKCQATHSDCLFGTFHVVNDCKLGRQVRGRRFRLEVLKGFVSSSELCPERGSVEQDLSGRRQTFRPILNFNQSFERDSEPMISRAPVWLDLQLTRGTTGFGV